MNSADTQCRRIPVLYAGKEAGARKALALVLFTALSLVAVRPLQAQSFTVLYAFPGGPNGDFPSAGLVLDNSGNLYGTTYAAGAGSFNCNFGCGTVFELNTAGQEIVLHNFGETSTDGSYPEYGSLIRDNAGNLYGTASSGGANGSGIVFALSPAGKQTIFALPGGAGGALPLGGLVRDSQGNLYGTTVYGGSACPPYGCGTVFKVSGAGLQTVLHSFTGGTDGEYPYAGLIEDRAGNLYGTTLGGGPCNCGTVFKIDASGQETVLYSFSDGTDGASPADSLILDSAGNLYGTTIGGGTNFDGTVFKITPDGQESVLHAFTGSPDGQFPYFALLRDAAGNLFGTTNQGGANGAGTVFEVKPNGQEYVLYSFCSQPGCTDGSNPYSSLVRDDKGNLYGTANSGGDIPCDAPIGCGVVFKLVSPPTITKFSPGSGAPGTTVVISGVSFSQATGVGFDGAAATTFTVNSDTQVTAIVPVGAVSGKITVTSPGGTATSLKSFIVIK